MPAPARGRKLAGFLRRHRNAEETAAEAVLIDVVWGFLRKFLGFGAGVAAAATIATLTTGGAPAFHPGYSLSAKGAAFVTRNEGVRYRPYNDPWNCTVGVGHLIHLGRCTPAEFVRWTVTPAQSNALLLRDASVSERYVRTGVTRPITQGQFDALVDLTFNIGGAGFLRSSVLRDVNAGNRADIERAFGRWSYASGHFLPGLYSRRMAEARLFLTGYYGPGIGYFVAPKVVTPAVQRATLRAWILAQRRKGTPWPVLKATPQWSAFKALGGS